MGIGQGYTAIGLGICAVKGYIILLKIMLLRLAIDSHLFSDFLQGPDDQQLLSGVTCVVDFICSIGDDT